MRFKYTYLSREEVFKYVLTFSFYNQYMNLRGYRTEYI